ncbi:MAG: PEP-CTERM sorting domain-containing protein [Puniceicoccales bacterium]
MKTIILAAIAATPLAYSDSFIDDFANADNLAVVEESSISVTGNILTATRNDNSSGAGVNWYNNGSPRFSIDAADGENILQITPSAQVGNGEWKTDIYLFNDIGGYLGQLEVFSFSASTNIASSDIANLVALPHPSAAEYEVRIWLQGDTNSGFEFSQFAAVPEPSHYALLGGAALGLIAILRRRRK